MRRRTNPKIVTLRNALMVSAIAVSSLRITKPKIGTRLHIRYLHTSRQTDRQTDRPPARPRQTDRQTKTERTGQTRPDHRPDHRPDQTQTQNQTQTQTHTHTHTHARAHAHTHTNSLLVPCRYLGRGPTAANLATFHVPSPPGKGHTLVLLQSAATV